MFHYINIHSRRVDAVVGPPKGAKVPLVMDDIACQLTA